ncbi:MAG: sugar phosphate isomerase/epimerase [Armatimonadetes bacterium]|nr:sugar phosphate isomerase/epimerase [Armatimonadota bacterium]
MPDSRIPFLLTAYGLPHVMGYLPTKDGQPHPRPLGPIGLMDAAVELGLSGVEFPLPSKQMLPPDQRLSASTAGVQVSQTLTPERVKEELDRRGLTMIPDYMVIVNAEVEETVAYLKAALTVGATVVRATLSNILCGDRRKLEEGWEARLEAVAKKMNALIPYAEDLGVCIALENHQDASCDDLLLLAEMTGNSPAFGVTLDAGNPLAVGEGPVETAERLAPIIRHVHMKDYTIHFAPEGYRLVRCAAGDGVVDFPAIMEILRKTGNEVTYGIEIAAQPTRTIPLLEVGWWACYPPTPATQLIPALQILWEKGRPMDEPYASAWERGADSQAVSAEEWDVVRRSVDYFRSIC